MNLERDERADIQYTTTFSRFQISSEEQALLPIPWLQTFLELSISAKLRPQDQRSSKQPMMGSPQGKLMATSHLKFFQFRVLKSAAIKLSLPS